MNELLQHFFVIALLLLIGARIGYGFWLHNKYKRQRQEKADALLESVKELLKRK